MHMAFQPTPAQRDYIYKVAIAAIPVLTVLGVVLPGDADTWLALVAAVLGVGGLGVAKANVSEGPRDLGQ